MASEATIKAALTWAKKGIPVFPCARNKAPITANGHLDATTSATEVRFLFENAPEDCMIGARMGEDSQLFALDFDLYKHGAQDYMQYLSDKGLLDETQIHVTQSGGLHFLYRGDGAYPNVKPHVGVEVKGEGGYIIVPPSSGYKIQKTGIAYANPKLIEELLNARKAASSSTVDSLKREILSGKAFHDPLAQIAARRSAQGWPVEKVQQELLDCLRASAASSKTHARHTRWKMLTEDGGEELSRIVGSGNDKFNPNIHTEKTKENVSDDLYRNLFDGSEGLFPNRDTPDGEGNSERSESTKIPDWGTGSWPFEGSGYFSHTERNIFDQSYVAYPLFAERESILLAAEPKAGKTAIALKLALQVAIGESMGHDFQVSDPRPVLYFTLEGARAVEMRIRAELNDRKDRGVDTPERDMLYVVDRPHNFATPELRDGNCAKIVLHNEMCKQEWGTELGLIVIDTLTKAMPGKDQNSVEDTSELFELIGFLRSNGVNATIVFIHHLSKQGHVRGSTNIEAEVDVVLGVSKGKDDGLVHMDVRRARSMDEDVGYSFRFESHHLGETKQGYQLHAPIVRLASAQDADVGATAAMAARYARAMDALVSLGMGTHPIAAVVGVLGDVANITPPSGRRPNYKTKAIQKALDDLFAGQINWAYGNYILKTEKDSDGHYTAVKILHAT